MGAFSQRMGRSKSKSPNKSKLTRHSVPVPEWRPEAPSYSKDTPQTSEEMEEAKPTLPPGGCVNQPNHQECESHCVRPNQRLYIDYSVRQCQRRTNFKSLKPQPYLKPVSSYCRTGKQEFAGRSGQKRRRRVTCMESVYKLETANNEELLDLAKPELAYLIVDLIRGSPLDFDELEEGDTDSPTSEEQRESPTMSTTAVDKPMPPPRKKTSNVNSSVESPESSNKYSPTPPPVPIRQSSLIKQLGEETLSSSSVPNDDCISNQQTEKRETSPPPQDIISTVKPVQKRETSTPPGDIISAVKPVPVPRGRSKSIAGNRPVVFTKGGTPPPRDHPPPPPHDPPPLPPHDPPPPLPSKSPLSREIQQSIKGKPHPREPPPIPKPYGTPKNEMIISTQSNDCYGAQQADGYEVSDIAVGSAVIDAPEQLYIDPLEAVHLSPEKTKPPRPPLPSSTAIRKAQQRKTRTLNKQSRTQLTNKRSNLHSKATTDRRTDPRSKATTDHRTDPRSKATTDHRTDPRSKATTDRRSNLHSKPTTDLRTKHNPPPSSSLPSNSASSDPANKQNDYEELDVDDPYSPPSQSYPPPVVISNTGQVISSQSNTGDAPPLPPRSSTPGPRKMHHEIKRTTSKPIPSGFTLNSNTDILDSRKSNELEQEGKNPEWDNDDIYEPVDTSLPVTPKRTKWNIRGTRTSPPVDPKVPKGGAKSSPLSQRKTTPESQKIHKQALVATSSVKPQIQLKSSRYSLKPSRSLSSSTEKDLVTKVSQLNVKEDVPGTEEYVDMECRIGWTSEDEEDTQDIYVDMQPVNLDADGGQEDRPCMECYSSHDRQNLNT